MHRALSRTRLSAAAALAVGVTSIFVAPASATHHEHVAVRLHNQKIHFAGAGQNPNTDEDFCTQIGRGDGALTEARLRNIVDDALLWQGTRWDGAGNWRLDLYHTASNCFDPIYGDRSSIEIQYRTYKTQTDGKWCADGTSCVSHYNQIASGTGHTDYRNEVVWLDQDHATYPQYWARHLISHETGHVVGFRDPNYHGDCSSPASIMHIPAYGCADPGSGPTVNDLNVLANDIMASLTH